MPKLSDSLMQFIAGQGVGHVFLVTGGGAMRLNDSLANNPHLTPICNSHEQASAICAEVYAKATGGLGRTGHSRSGGTNAVTGVGLETAFASGTGQAAWRPSEHRVGLMRG